MYDVAIVGCGVIGAASAYMLSRYKLKVIVLEKENDVCMGATRANSGIIHAGYDPVPGTLMARLNVRGAALAKELCKQLDVPFEQTGSMVVAFSESENEALGELLERGRKNGVEGLRIITGDEARELEPLLSKEACAALLAPSAGIINPWEYGLAMTEVAARNGVELRLNSGVTDIRKKLTCWELETEGGRVQARFVINAAGIYSDRVHNMAQPESFTIIPRRGEYYLLDKSEGKRARHVLFQCPNELGKGTLVAPTVHGNLIVGPNNEPCEREDTATTAEGLAFVRDMAVKTIPGISWRDNIRNFSGIRAHSDKNDFIIRLERGMLDLAGICSPGLSAAPAIGEYAVELLKDAGLKLSEKSDWHGERRHVRIAGLSPEQINELIKLRPEYGRVICRCETVTEGEILDALESPVPPCSIDGIKRRAGTGMGRCQGGFCSPRVLDILARRLGKKPSEILLDAQGSFVLTGETKRAEEDK